MKSDKKEPNIRLNNKEVIQSYLLTAARYNFNVYEKRILFRLVELCQTFLEGKKLNGEFELTTDAKFNKDVKIPIAMLLNGEDDHNHSRIKTALESLNKKSFIYEDSKIWKPIRLIEMPELQKYDEFVEFKIHKEIYEAILDFSKGYRKYELVTAMKFKSVYAMRFYELFSECKSPIMYTIDSLKIMFGIENKYARINDFFKYVINSAQKELNENSPYSFDYNPIKTGKKITKIEFSPKYIPENKDPELYKKSLNKEVSPMWYLDSMIINYLKENFGFSSKEMKANADLFIKAYTDIDLLLFMSQIKTKCENVENPKGYLINAIKRELNIEPQQKLKL